MEQTAGQKLFAGQSDFVGAGTALPHYPKPDKPEIAFVGRSNVGKSSLLNALLGRRALARVSRTPGRTQQINFFLVGERMLLADLPGYGYAAVPMNEKEKWETMIAEYLQHRETLRLVIQLVDARHGAKPGDILAMRMLQNLNIPFLAVMTKSDKVAAKDLATEKEKLKAKLKSFPIAGREPIAISSSKLQGIDDLRDAIAEVMFPED